MRRIQTLIMVFAVVACGSKKDENGTQGSAGSADIKAVEQPGPAKCPAGNVVKDGACLAVVTPEKIDVVVKQQTRIDDLAKLLDKVDTISAPIELLDGFRQLDQWKALKAKSSKLEIVDTVVASLTNTVKTLRAFRR